MNWDWAILSPWTWLAAAAVLAGLEILSPGAFMIWLAGAAVVSAAIAAIFAPAWETQLLVFVALAVVSVIGGRAWLRAHPTASRDPKLNRRATRMVGSLVTVVEPIVGGTGRVQVGDAPWAATGPDMAAGTRARVVRVEGTTLVVDQAINASG